MITNLIKPYMGMLTLPHLIGRNCPEFHNKFGTNGSFECGSLAQQIWAWAAKANIWLSPTHLPRVQNFEADLESCKQEIHMKWKLKESVFQFFCRKLDLSPNIDLFSRRINTQLPIFASYRSDPECVVAMHFCWIVSKWTFMYFPHLLV